MNPTRYALSEDGLSIFGSYETFNRVLYGGHDGDARQERYFTFAGDAPLFMGAASDYEKDTWCYQAKNGVFQSGLALTEGYSMPGRRDSYSCWFHNSSDILARWHHGYMSYDLTQISSYFPNVRVHMEVYPLNPQEGFVVCYDIATDQQVLFCGGLGGITPFFGRFEYHFSDRKDYGISDSDGNQAQLLPCGGRLTGPGDVSLLIGDDFGCQYRLDVPDAMLEVHPAQFLSRHGDEPRVIKLCRQLEAGEHLQGRVVVLRNGTEEQLKQLLADKELVRQLRCRCREKFGKVLLDTPDDALNQSVPDTMIALDASFHGRSYYHGAIGYHAPFLGWRGWYAPTLLGWADRVCKAIRSHFDTITRFDGEEKVWWDGADRPDLDHEGTQYHHLLNSSGHLTALLHRDDIYDMQEVALDMTLYYLEATEDMETAKAIFPRIVEILDWEERILDPDGDGLYQNFLNTWISDGHSYDGAGCAQASAYNYAANKRAATIGAAFGYDVSRLEARAMKIYFAIQEKLWLPKEGVVAESLDTLGCCMVHPSPELSTTYLAIDCETVTPLQAWRMLAWTRRNIPSVRTAGPRGGTLYFSSNWLPKKYSTHGIFPAENACLALAFYQNGQPERGYEILQALADAYQLSPNPGSFTHVFAASGSSDGGDIDFTDVSSTYLRLVLEGLWGIRYRNGRMAIAPQLPDEWKHASFHLPDVYVELTRGDDFDHIAFNAPSCPAYLRLPMRFAVLDQVLVDGATQKAVVTPGFNRGFVEIAGLKPGRHEVRIYYEKRSFPSLAQAEIIAYPGNRELIPILNGAVRSVKGEAEVLPGGVVVMPSVQTDVFVYSGDVILPLTLTPILPKEEPCRPDLSSQSPLDISCRFNASVTAVHQQEFRSPRPKGYSIGMRLNGRYAWEWNHYGHNALHVDDSVLRRNGGVTAASGWRFVSPAVGDNAAVVSLWDNFPSALEIPLQGHGQHLAVLFCGTTNAMQSYVTNGRFTVLYQDGAAPAVQLVQPLNFDDFLLPSYQRGNEAVTIGEGTHALVQIIPLDGARELKALRVDAVANEVIIQVLAVSLA